MSAHRYRQRQVDLMLDAVEAAGKSGPSKNRASILFTILPRRGHNGSRRKLGVCLDTQPAWYFKDADALLTAWAPNGSASS